MAALRIRDHGQFRRHHHSRSRSPVSSSVREPLCGSYRRPLPSTNLRFLWDGRESSAQTGTQTITFATNPGDLLADLAHQSLDATNGHAQASTPLTVQQQQAIVDFEMPLITAQAATGASTHGARFYSAARIELRPR